MIWKTSVNGRSKTTSEFCIWNWRGSSSGLTSIEKILNCPVLSFLGTFQTHSNDRNRSFYIYSSPSNSTMSKNQVDRSEFAAQQDLTEWIDLPFSGRPLLYLTAYSPVKGLRAPKTSTRYVLLSNPALDQQIGHWLHLAQSISMHLQQNQIESGMIDYISPESKLNHLVQSPNGWKRETSYSLRGIQIQTLNGSMQLIKGFLRSGIPYIPLISASLTGFSNPQRYHTPINIPSLTRERDDRYTLPNPPNTSVSTLFLHFSINILT